MEQENSATVNKDAYSYTAEEYQTMLKKNMRPKKYAVTLDFDQKDVHIPSYCTCCLQKTDTVLAVTQTSERYHRTGITISFDFPFCQECVRHYYRALVQERKVFYLPLLSLVLFAISLFLGFDIYYSPLILIGAHLILFILFGKMLKAAALGPEHSGLMESASILPLSPIFTTVTFLFANWLYATLFAGANNAEMQVENISSQKNRASIISYIRNPLLLYIGSLAATLGAGLVIWLIFFCT